MPDFSLVASILAAVLTAQGVGKLVSNFFKNTIGRRRDHYSRISRLAPMTRVEYFSSVLGQPPAMKLARSRRMANATDPCTENVWIDRDYYVSALADSTDTIFAFSVTTRSEEFNPKIPSWGGVLPNARLLKTRFAEAQSSPG